ncbi:MAG: hypothetical protein OHK0022_19520 [Roseiflexaceae bacterium]
MSSATLHPAKRWLSWLLLVALFSTHLPTNKVSASTPTDTPSQHDRPATRVAALTAQSVPPTQPSQAQSTALPASYIETARQLYGTRHTVTTDLSDIGEFNTPSQTNYTAAGPFTLNFYDEGTYYLTVPAGVVRDSLEFDISITAKDNRSVYYDISTNVEVCEDIPNGLCSTGDTAFVAQPTGPSNGGDYTETAQNVKISLGNFVPRSKSAHIKLYCSTDNVNGSCTWSNLRFYEDIGPWTPNFKRVSPNWSFYTTGGVFDGINPRTFSNTFAAIRVRDDSYGYTFYRSPLVIMPHLINTDVLTASVLWARTFYNNTLNEPRYSNVSVRFVPATGDFPTVFLSLPTTQGSASVGWTKQLNIPGNMLPHQFSDRAGWLEIIVGGSSANHTVGLDSLEFFLNGRPIGLRSAPTDQVSGICPCVTGSTVQRESAGSVNTATGSFNYRITDLSIDSNGPPLIFSRSYLSQFANGDFYPASVMGQGWRHSFDHRLLLPRSDNAPVRNSEYTIAIYEAPSGNRLRFLKDGNSYTALPGVYGKLTSIQNGYLLSLRDQSVLLFDEQGRVTQQRDPQGHALTYSYYSNDGTPNANQLQKVQDRAGHTLNFSYVAQQSWHPSRLASVTDSANRTVTFTYDNQFNVNSASRLGGGSNVYGYWYHQLRTISTVTANQTIQHVSNAYDYLDRIVGQSFPDGSSLNYTYNRTPEGPATTITNQNGGQQSSYTDHYRPDGTLEWQEQAGMFRSYMTFDSASLAPTTSVDGAGSATTITPNALGQPTSMSDPVGLTTTFSYRPQDQRLSQITTPDYTTTELTYDSNGVLLQVSRSGSLLHEHVFYTWESLNGDRHLAEMRSDDGVITRYGYGAGDQITSVTLGYGLPEAQQTTLGYDAVGRVITTTIGLGTPFQRVDVTRYNPDSTVTQRIQNYTGSGVYSTLSPDQNITTSYGYDAFGRQIWQRDTLGRYSWARGYDAVGRVAWEARNPRDATGTPVVPIAKPAYSPAQPDANVVVSYGYDLLGRTAFVTQTGILTGTFSPTTLQWSAATERVTHYQYDTLGRVVTTTLNYRADQPVDQLPDANIITLNRYDGAGKLIWQRDALGRWTKYEYDNAGKPTTTIANYENGDPATVTYANGNWPSTTDTDITTVTHYNSVGQTWKVIQNYMDGVYDPAQPDADRTDLYIYDGLGRVINSVENYANTNSPDLNRARVTKYNPFTNQMIGRQDVLGRWSITEYDALGRPWRTTKNCRDTSGLPTSQGCAAFDPTPAASDRNVRTETRYNALGQPFETVDPLGMVTRIFYDALGRTTATYQNYRADLPDDAQTNVVSRIRYNGLGQRVAYVDAHNQSLLLGYNGLGQTSVITDPVGRVGLLGYDGTGVQRWSRTPDGRLAVQKVDGLGRVVETIRNYQDGVVGATESADQDVIHQVRYDAAGNKVRETSPTGRITLFSYDLLDRLISVSENASSGICAKPPCDVRTYYEYNRAGNRTLIRDARNHTRSFTYDTADQVTSTTDPLMRTTSWEYNAAGQRIRQDDPRGSSFDLTYSFDGLDRLSEVQAGSSTNLVPISLSYNARSEQLSMTDGTGTTSFSYDLLGRITEVNAPDTGAVVYTYNALGQRTGINYPGIGAPSLTYSYKPDGQLDYVNQSQHALPLAQYSYDSAGRLQQISRENGATTLLSYSATDQVRELRTQVGSSDISRFQYTFDRDGQTSAVTETLGLSTRSISYGYDGLARLTSADTSSGADYAYEYDPVGNRTGVWVNGSRTVTLAYDAANQVQGWQYDAAGNLLNDSTTTQTYDALGRVTSSIATNQTSNFSYNASGALVARTSGGVTTRYVQDLTTSLPQVLQSQTGSSRASFLYGLGRLAVQQHSGARSWFIGDALGSVRQTLSDSSTLLGSVAYDPWGKVENGSVPTFGFTGELHDDTSGLVYLRARWYNPASAAFVSVDPFEGVPELPGTLPSYQYAGNNPLRYTDPSGKCWAIFAPACALAAGVVGGGSTAAAAGGTAAVAGSTIAAAVATPFLLAGTIYLYTLHPDAENQRANLARGVDYVLNGGKGYAWKDSGSSATFTEEPTMAPRHTGNNQKPIEPPKPTGPSEQPIKKDTNRLANPLPVAQPCPVLQFPLPQESGMPIETFPWLDEPGPIVSAIDPTPGDIAKDTKYLPTQPTVRWYYVQQYKDELLADPEAFWRKFSKSEKADEDERMHIVYAPNGTFLEHGHHRFLAILLAGLRFPEDVPKYAWTNEELDVPYPQPYERDPWTQILQWSEVRWIYKK